MRETASPQTHTLRCGRQVSEMEGQSHSQPGTNPGSQPWDHKSIFLRALVSSPVKTRPAPPPPPAAEGIK